MVDRIKKRVTDKFDEIEEIRKLTLSDIMRERRWALIWEIFKQKKMMFPELSDELILEMAKQEVITIRQLSRTGML
ncbi:MAG: hypothetical protein QXI58_06750 [Candidatus Micrarchaeia archaeon]